MPAESGSPGNGGESETAFCLAGALPAASGDGGSRGIGAEIASQEPRCSLQGLQPPAGLERQAGRRDLGPAALRIRARKIARRPMSGELCALSDLRPGVCAWVAEVTGPDRARLLELGFVPGTPVELVRAAPMGDPLEVRLRGSRISLRREEADWVRVALEPGTAYRLRFRALAYPAGQAVTVSINGREVESVTLAQGWVEYEVLLPADAILPDEVTTLAFVHAVARAPFDATGGSSSDARALTAAYDRLCFEKVP